ncbi:MAG: hypothetical protein IJT13_01315 [Bacteroidaceae bacterium]|nr:hypothetical protein [Bacteroidaceae bacterium]
MMLESKYGDRTAFLTKFNPDVQRELCSDAEECYFGDYPTLTHIRLAYGNNAPVMWLVAQLYNLSEYCGCKGKLEGKPLEECAHIISMEFHYLKVSELMLFFYRFKTGRYGRFYGSVDPLIITESLRMFCDERSSAYTRHEQEQRKQREAEQRKLAIPYDEYLRRRKNETIKNTNV